ncbi:hypothetical protein BH09MYX1_BH09MYX1_38470 [soil metagenome]
MKTGIFAMSLGATAPKSVGSRPQVVALAGLVAMALAAACAQTDDNQVTEPAVVGMTDKMPAYYDDGQVQIYQVTTPVKLPMRMPTAEEKAALKAMAPYPREPFIKADDVRTEIRFTISNLDDKRQAVELLVDPWNEFVYYLPAIQIVSDEQTTPDLSGFDKFYILEPKGRIQGVITADDTRELAYDLATAMNLATIPPDPESNANGLFNHVMNLQNRSTSPSPLVAKFIPAVAPAMIGFDLGLRSYSPMNIAVEVSVDVQDQSTTGNSRVVPPSATDPTYKKPGASLSPPKVPMQM